MKVRYIAVIVLLLSLVLALAGGFGMMWRFFVLLVVILGMSYLWTRIGAKNISGEVGNVMAYCRAGDSIDEYFTVSNNGRITTSMIEALEESDIPGYSNKTTAVLSPGGSQSWRTTVRCRRRGRYDLGSLIVRVTDPLGIFSVQRNIGRKQRIIVYPEIRELPYFQTVPGLEPGASPRRWLATEISPNAARVREYNSGDSLRHIHWHSTAHTGGLMVKEFDPDRSNVFCRDVWLFPDMYSSAGIGYGQDTMEEYIIMTAASLAKKYIDSDKEVGLIASGDRAHLFTPKKGEQHLQKMLQALAQVRAAGTIGIERLVAMEQGRFGSGSVVIVIASSDNRSIALPLRRAVGRGAIAMVILMDALSFGGKTNAAGTAHNLVSNGITVYVIRRGMDIARALDSRVHSSHM